MMRDQRTSLLRRVLYETLLRVVCGAAAVVVIISIISLWLEITGIYSVWPVVVVVALCVARDIYKAVRR